MDDIKVLGISGKKQSGKDTTANYIVGVFMEALKIVEEFKITDDGRLWVSDIFGNTQYEGYLNIDSQHPNFLDFAETNVFPFVKTYSYADLLKQEVCINILGLTWDQCYGTDEQKNTPTHLKWEDMPNVTTIKTPQNTVDAEVAGRLGAYYEKCFNGLTYHKPGPMTAREVMQFVGSEIFRKMYGNVWVDATLRRIEQDAPSMAIIRDVRFKSELELTQKYGGKIMRLSRNVSNDNHISEIDLDDVDSDKFDFYLDNQNMSIQEQNDQIHEFLKSIQWIPHEIPQELLDKSGYNTQSDV